MQKDYYEITEVEEMQSELERVDAFWSNVWAERQFSYQAIETQIQASSEYKLLSSHLNSLEKGAKILDGGCGMGDWTRFFAQKQYQPYGVDISSSTIERLNEKFPDLNWQTGDINNLSFSDNYFDAYISWGTFEHFEAGLGKPIEEAFRVLKPGGHLWITIPHDSLRLFMQKYGRLPRKNINLMKAYAFYQWRLTPKEIAFELEQYAFEISSITPIHKVESLGRLYTSIFKKPTNGPIIARILKLLSFFVPSRVFGHMLMIVARKPS